MPVSNRVWVVGTNEYPTKCTTQALIEVEETMYVLMDTCAVFGLYHLYLCGGRIFQVTGIMPTSASVSSRTDRLVVKSTFLSQRSVDNQVSCAAFTNRNLVSLFITWECAPG